MDEENFNLLIEEEPVKIKEDVKPSKPIVLLTFDRWFALQNRPAHHKLGMRAFASTKGKKPKEVWDKIFATY